MVSYQQKQNHTPLIVLLSIGVLTVLGWMFYITTTSLDQVEIAYQQVVEARVRILQVPPESSHSYLQELHLLDSLLERNPVISRMGLLDSSTTRILSSLESILGDKARTIFSGQSPEPFLQALQEQLHQLQGDLFLAANRLVLLFGLFGLLILFVLLIMTTRLEQEKQARMWDLQVTGDFIAREEELKRSIARELHDDIAQTLALAKLSEPRDALDLIGDAIQKIRTLTRNLSLPVRLNAHLGSAIHDLVEMFRDIGNFAIDYHVSGDIDGMTHASMNTHLFRITQELFQNTLKHSRASKVSLSIHQAPDLLTLRYADDGVGMVNNLQNSGLGLRNMRDRATLLKGTLTIQTSVGNGFRASLDVPLEVPTRK